MKQSTDFVHTVGREHYSRADFLNEAKNLGISRRVGRLPDGLIPGSSRVYLVFDASRDSAPRKCVRCGHKPMPKPVRNAAGLPVATCDQCGETHEGKTFLAGNITHFFTPNAIEVVVKVDDAKARELAEVYQALGILNPTSVVDTPEQLTMSVSLFESTVGDTLRVLEEHGAKLDATALAGIIGHQGTVAIVGHEPKRGCGYRHHGGLYVKGSTVSPITELAVPIGYTKPHFRGLRQLTEVESAASRAHVEAGALADPLTIPFEVAKATPAGPDHQTLAANDDSFQAAAV